MLFAEIDTAAVARALAQIADQPEDLADVFFERREIIELPGEDASPGLRVWREAGLAVRLLRGGRSWLAGRDEISADAFQEALRRAARALPRAPLAGPQITASSWPDPPHAPEVLEFPALLQRAVRAHHVGTTPLLTLQRHRRWVQIVGTRFSSGCERELFYSLNARLENGRLGMLLTELGETIAEQVAGALVLAHKAATAPKIETWRGPCVLGANATAVLLHEAVAHALEADTLAQGGHPEAAVGVELGPPELSVIDDPQTAPDSVRRTVDDEGFPVFRRWLLRQGKVEQPLCDGAWAHRSDLLVAGAGRRSHRHAPPVPRSSHLELLPGELSLQELMQGAEGGLYFPEVERGRLDPLTGELTICFPYGRRIHHHLPSTPVGPATLHGHVSDLLHAITGIGSELRYAGAGWCAKGGVKLPVWAKVPALRIEGLEVGP